jgi:hypothetical protein
MRRPQVLIAFNWLSSVAGDVICFLWGANWGFYIPEDGTLQSHRRENLKSYTVQFALAYSVVTLRTSEPQSSDWEQDTRCVGSLGPLE